MLTTRQRQCLLFIQERLIATGVAPAMTDICDHMGFASKSVAHRLVLALEERGHIRRLRNRARALEVVKPVAYKTQAFVFDDVSKTLRPL